MTEMTVDIENNPNITNDNDVVQFIIQRLYMKDLSFEAPHTPSIFQQEWNPELALNVFCENNILDDNIYEVILTVTVKVTNQSTVAFIVEAKQAGIFMISGAIDEQLKHLLGSFCPNILFPYARAAITAQVVNGSFPQLILAPINFDAIYMQNNGQMHK